MGRTFLMWVLILGIIAPASHAQDVLSTEGTDLGRFVVSNLPGDISWIVDLQGQSPITTHITARFQNNRPLMKRSNGSWGLWSGVFGDLENLNLVPNGNVLVYDIGSQTLPGIFFPVVITLAYRTNTELLWGYLTFDES